MSASVLLSSKDEIRRSIINAALLIARLLLALIFTVAGAAKLADRQGSRQAIVDFGAPSALAASLGLMLPLAELAVAATLLPPSTAWWGAVGALALLSVFIVGISPSTWLGVANQSATASGNSTPPRQAGRR
ncbi:MAG TPA: MauE/DoxX family redox-associated membrane protein [Rubrobacter sp.]